MWLLIPFLLTVHVGICLLLVLVVLMQLPRSEGLGAAFGGGVTENIFGAQTTNVLAKFTVWLGIGFFVVTLLLAISYSRLNSGKVRSENRLMDAPISGQAAEAPAAAGAAATVPVTETPAIPAEKPEDFAPVQQADPAPADEAVPAADPAP